MTTNYRVLSSPDDLTDPGDVIQWLADVDEQYGEPPTSVADLADDIVTEATALETEATSLALADLVAQGLLDTLTGAGVDDRWLVPATRSAHIVRAASERTTGAIGTARRVVSRVTDGARRLDQGADPEAVYDELLTTRLHLPITASLVEDASADAHAALRDLARVALASSRTVEDPTDELARRAEGVLRFTPPGLHTTTLAGETPALWSTTIDELRLEVAGLLANVVLDRRTTICIAHTGRTNRFVQALSFDRGLWIETVSNAFLDEGEQLTDRDHERLHALGWSEPTGTEPHPNWFRQSDDEVDLVTAADLLVDTLVEVHGVTTPDDLAVTTAPTVDPYGT
jgi:hypothetical protein